MNPFVCLSEEESEAFVPLSEEEIEKALEEGRKEADALQYSKDMRVIQGRFV
jgi:hypothetical protein